MMRFIAIIFGIAFIFVGVAGFLPQFMAGGLLFGFFEASTIHNIIHIVSGVLAIMAATSYRYAKLYFRVFGIIYAIFAIAGIFNVDLHVLFFNTADNVLNVLIAIVALYLGFARSRVSTSV